MMQHIPTGPYQLHRPRTPLDPDPKGPVYDGGLMVDKGDPVVQDTSALRNLPPTAARPRTPEELRKKYTLGENPRNRVAIFTLPRRTPLSEILVDAYSVHSAANKPQLLSEDMMSRLMDSGRFSDTFTWPTPIGICGFVPRTDTLRGNKLRAYLTSRQVQLPSSEHLIAACVLYHAVTGRHLVPENRIAKAADGVVEVKNSRLYAHLEDYEKFERSPQLLVTGRVKSINQSPTVEWTDRMLARLKHWLQLD
jgi:hypothetical protein